MENLVFQWDKACDAMPVLRPASKSLVIILFLALIFVVLPWSMNVVNEDRPHPNLTTSYDAIAGDFTREYRNVNPEDTFHNVEAARLGEIVGNRQKSVQVKPAELPITSNIVSQEVEGGIGQVADRVLAEEVWDYDVEVAFIVDSAYGRKRLKIETGIFVDSRDLQEISRHSQKVTLDPPTPNRSPLENYNVVVKTMRSVVTQCTYYSMHIFGAERLVLGGSGGDIDTGC